MATVDDKKIIFSMVGLSKTIRQNNKQVLKNIYLSFFYGAKIGIIGLNGAGKSTLLKIIAGLDQDYQGEVVFAPGYSVGYLPQDPHLDDEKTVREIVQEGVADVVAALKEYEEINQKFGLPEYYEDEDKMNELFTRQGELQDILDATDAWNLDSRLDRAMAALRCPPADRIAKTSREAKDDASHSADSCSKNRTYSSSTNPPTTSTQKASTGWNNTSTATKERSSPSPTTATSSTTSPAGFSNLTEEKEFLGRETILPGSNRKPNASNRKRKLPENDAKLWNENSNGCAWLPKQDKPREKPDSIPTNDS